jgi:2C-methyl-D-erythritol 2,4-cyclodiphosphate synthase
LPDVWYVYVDETGNLDMQVDKAGATPYFGIGTAIYKGEHSSAIWEAQQLRLELGSAAVSLEKGFHAHQDSALTRHRVIDLILAQKPELDVTILAKRNAYERVRARIVEEPTLLYRHAWYQHFKFLAQYRIPKDVDIRVICGHMGTKKQAKEVRAAIDAVCQTELAGRNFGIVSWETATAWPLQVADYASWCAYRSSVELSCRFHDRLRPLYKSTFRPWGRDVPLLISAAAKK